jgi:hypothetical protein
MRKQAGIATVVAIAALAIVFGVKSGVLSADIAPVSFIERWAPVDEALRSGTFSSKDSAVDAR